MSAFTSNTPSSLQATTPTTMFVIEPSPLARRLHKTALAVLCSVSLFSTSQVLAQDQNWQPVASESLIKLPANLIEKRIQQDFEMSPMASAIMQIEEQLLSKSSQIKALQKLLAQAADTQMVEEKVNLVQLKSAYLDLMQEGQDLRQQALDKKQSLYQDILGDLLRANNSVSNQDFVQLKAQQEKARQRMEAVIAQVDQTLLHDGFDKQSPYADEFAKNLHKIEQLKSAISKHKASMAPTIDGVEVTAQEYVRQLLMQASGDQSLLDQEALMLSYMAKIVALDAQALEYDLAYQDEEQGAAQDVISKASHAVDLFL